jgi:hypothetical protein
MSVFKIQGSRAMKKIFWIVSLTAFLSLSSMDALCQNAPAASGPKAGANDASMVVVGIVTAVNTAAMQATVKTDAGAFVNILFDEKTEFLRLRPEDKGLETATHITFSALNVGDRILTRNNLSAENKPLPVRRVVVMTSADVSKKQERDREEWNRRGILGVITGLDPQTKEIKLQLRSGATTQQIVLVPSERTRFRRYAPDSVKFSDARDSSFAELQVGDQLRALGDKSSDGSRFTPEELVSGSFRTIGGAITAINPQTNEITINDIQTHQTFTVAVGNDALLRRLPPEAARSFVPAEQHGDGGKGGQAAQTSQAAQGHADLQAMLEKAPTVTLAELKKGDLVLVTSTKGATESHVTAIAVVLGLDALLKQVQRASSSRNQGPNLGGTGLPGGIGLP